MNPRVSRSSALASKATGFPIAKIAARLAVGYALEEIDNDITRRTPASFEPTIDYVVVKWPRFAFEKFPGADGQPRHLHAERGRGDGDRAHVQAGVRQGDALARARRDRRAAGGHRRAARRPRAPRRRPLRADLRGVPARRLRARAPRAHVDRPVVPGGDRGARPRRGPGGGPRAHVQVGRHVRGRVRGRDAVLLLRLGAAGARRPAARGPPRRPRRA